MNGVSDDVAEGESEDMSPIELAEKAKVRPQLVYNYIKAGRIPAFEGKDSRLRIKTPDALHWMEDFLERRALREARRQEKIRQELEGN